LARSEGAWQEVTGRGEENHATHVRGRGEGIKVRDRGKVVGRQ